MISAFKHAFICVDKCARPVGGHWLTSPANCCASLSTFFVSLRQPMLGDGSMNKLFEKEAFKCGEFWENTELFCMVVKPYCCIFIWNSLMLRQTPGICTEVTVVFQVRQSVQTESIASSFLCSCCLHGPVIVVCLKHTLD